MLLGIFTREAVGFKEDESQAKDRPMATVCMNSSCPGKDTILQVFV